MQIEIKQGVVWDTEKAEQTPAAMDWMMSRVMPNIGEPKSFDENWRPLYWETTVDGWKVRVTYHYVHVNSASLKRQSIEFSFTKV